MAAAGSYGQQWTAPTAEELAMTSIAEVPGAPAVYLNRQQTTDDGLHMYSYYVRLKVLTDKGKEYANVELPYVTGVTGTQIDAIAGRTIHPDGTVIPFSGQPYDKLIAKTGEFERKAKVFTLPAVEVGSIIEYRYKIRYADHIVFSPDWMVQTELYTRKAHFMWRPTSHRVTTDNGRMVSRNIHWTPILREGEKVEETELPLSNGQKFDGPTTQLDLDVQNVPPVAKEDFMPPVESLRYRVLFYYTDVTTTREFWAQEGKLWSKDRERFIGPNQGVKSFVATLVSGGDTDDQKARKLYAAVMKMENTDFSRTHTEEEEKATGLREIKNSDDIAARQRGSGDQLTELFIAMCRAAGLKAYPMGVADRRKRIFLPQYLDVHQLDQLVAIVSIDGKDVYFDPGERYCEPEHLSWRHSTSGGLREVENGTEVTGTPSEIYKTAQVVRTANLMLNDKGGAFGTMAISSTGDPALHWRQLALRSDETGLREALEAELRRMVPDGFDVKVSGIENLTDYEKPLVVRFDAKGQLATATEKRLLVPADLFEVKEKQRFTEPKREYTVDMHYPSATRDAVRMMIPATLAVEAMPSPEKDTMGASALYSMSTKQEANALTVFRNFINGETLYPPDRYAELRTVYAKAAAKDQETVVLAKAAAATTAKPGN